MNRPHENLKVWKVSVALVTQLYEVTRGFPADERYGLTGQIRRASVSVPANIAEGAARGSDSEYLRFLRIARGSLSELETLLVIAKNLNLVDPKTFDRLSRESETIGSLLEGLSRKLKTSIVSDNEEPYEA